MPPRRPGTTRPVLRHVCRGLLGFLVVMLSLGTPVWAYWTHVGAGSANALTGTLSAPTSLTATTTPNTTNVHLTWTAATLSGGQAAQGYYAIRIRSSDSATSAACGSSAGALVAVTSCDDLAVPDGTFRYQVVAVYRGWTAVSAVSSPVVVDGVAPVAPSAPSLTAASDSGASSSDRITKVVTPTFTGTAEAGSTVTIFDGATSVGTGAATGGAYSITTSTLASGTHSMTAKATDSSGNTSTASAATTVTIDTLAPTVTINQAPAQLDPTVVSPVNFSVVFSETVTGFTSTAINFTGSAGATTATVTGSGTTYNVAITGMTRTGTVRPTISAGAAQDTAGNVSTASTSSDNTVQYNDITAPAAPSAPSLTAASDSGASSTDRVTNVTTPTFTGTAEAGSTVTLFDGVASVGTGTATGGTYAITSSALGSGVHILTAKATDSSGNTGLASAATTVTIDTVAPTVAINQAIGQADPTSAATVNFTAVFSEAVTGFTSTAINFTGTAGATTATVTGSGTTYNVAITGMTRTGTVRPTISGGSAQDTAGNTNTVSTSTDNTVQYNDTTAPVVAISSFRANAGSTVTVTGTAGTSPGDSTTVTVVICTSSSGTSCTGPATVTTLSATVNPATGAWTVTSGPLGARPTLYARASQTDVQTNKGTAIAGPIATS